MLGFLATLFCGGVIAAEDIKRGNIRATNRAEAMRKGDPIYFDGTGSRMRATETDEIVFHRIIDGRDEDVGIKTHRIYKCVDNNKAVEERCDEWLRRDNEQLKKDGMNFYWKRMPGWDTKKNGSTRLGYAQIDKENGKPIYYIKSYDNGETYNIQYARTNEKWMSCWIEDGRTKFDSRVISAEEYQKKYSRILNN